MVDFATLRKAKRKPAPIDPIEIFRRLPKPPGINDLYTSQAEVLAGWFANRSQLDTVLKLHTGGGKTMVGLLIAQSSINELREPVAYLCPTTQLVKQTLEKAAQLGISAVQYETGRPLNESFINGSALLVGTYRSLFHGYSKFGIRGGSGIPIKASTVILDDAHTAFAVIRESFTIEINSAEDKERYGEFCGFFRKAFRETERIGTFDDVVSGESGTVLEVPYWAWREKLDVVRESLRTGPQDSFSYVWPLLRDHLHLCHALISRKRFSITPIFPLVNLFPTFFDAGRRVYMSATIADDSEIIRTFAARADFVETALSSRSLAGISERLVLIPDLMPFHLNARESVKGLMAVVKTEFREGAVILVPSNKAAETWSEFATFPKGAALVEQAVQELQANKSVGPFVFANRYDGIDLPGSSCRLLIMDGLPAGTSDYELFRGAVLFGGATINRTLAQRIEQGIGRGARGAGDYCVIVLVGADLAGWIAKEANFLMLTAATRVQIDIGSAVSKEVKNAADLIGTMRKSLARDVEWVEYHAETLAEEVAAEVVDPDALVVASGERKAFDLWNDGYHEKAISKLCTTASNPTIDQQAQGWLLQLAARIAEDWGHPERADELQRAAFALNRNLLRPRAETPYAPLVASQDQSSAITKVVVGYRLRKGLLQRFEEVASYLHQGASANQFEQALVDLAELIGITAERHDVGGKGPDVLWLLSDNDAFIIEAKSRKSKTKPLTKEEHGQLLVAEEWFKSNYPRSGYTRVSVHSVNVATPQAEAGGSFALTSERLMLLVSDARAFFKELSETQGEGPDLERAVSKILVRSGLEVTKLKERYLKPFVETGLRG